ncbi:MAG: hypothetical protein OEV64_02355 [Desulfobulbaceae bacterium]|nr:hypothetical protein [Desulfobulbaceae bacterium]
MKNTRLQDQDIGEIINTALCALNAQNDREAALNAAELVNVTLGQLLRDVISSDFQASLLLDYPAPLSDLGSRADAAAAFRLIGGNVHRAVMLVRRIRNEASRSTYAFSLADHEEQLREIYNELETPWSALNECATKTIAEKLLQWIQIEEDGLWRRKYEEGILECPDKLRRELMENHQEGDQLTLPRFCLNIATSILCTLIVHDKDILLKGLSGNSLLVHALHKHSMVSVSRAA